MLPITRCTYILLNYYILKEEERSLSVAVLTHLLDLSDRCLWHFTLMYDKEVDSCSGEFCICLFKIRELNKFTD